MRAAVIQQPASMMIGFPAFTHALDNAGLTVSCGCLPTCLPYRAQVFVDPNYEIDERIKKLRQANFKLEYKQRLSSGNPMAVRSRSRARK
jgi:hypothetical protein